MVEGKETGPKVVLDLSEETEGKCVCQLNCEM